MKVIYLSIALLSSCAHTKIYSRDGKKIFKTQADIENMSYIQNSDGSIEWKVEKLNHSIPTESQGKAASGKINAVSAGLIGIGVGSLIK